MVKMNFVSNCFSILKRWLSVYFTFVLNIEEYSHEMSQIDIIDSRQLLTKSNPILQHHDNVISREKPSTLIWKRLEWIIVQENRNLFFSSLYFSFRINIILDVLYFVHPTIDSVINDIKLFTQNFTNCMHFVNSM